MSKIKNFEKIQILPFWTQKPIFWGAKGIKWMENLIVTYNPLKICHWRGKLMKKWPIYSVFFIFSPFSAFLDIFGHFWPFSGLELKSRWPEVSKMVLWTQIAHFIGESVLCCAVLCCVVLCCVVLCCVVLCVVLCCVVLCCVVCVCVCVWEKEWVCVCVCVCVCVPM